MRKPRKTIKDEYVRHPFTKQRLLVIDTFSPKNEVECPSCSSSSVNKIRTVESEYPGGVRYHMLDCEQCDRPVWVVILA